MKRLYLALAAAGAVLMAGVGLARCSAPIVPPAPPPVASPTPAAIASSLTAATATGAARVTLRRPVAPQSMPTFTGDGLSKDPASDLHSGYEEIVIEVTQTATAAASSEASSSAPAFSDQAPAFAQKRQEHACLGVVLLTAPGILALDYQLLRLDASPLSRPVLSVDLELGVDVAGNGQVGAVGVTAGGKAFAGGYAWSRWDLGAQGLAGGVGVRF